MNSAWINALRRHTDCLLSQQPGQVFQAMTRDFELTLIRCALAATGGRRIDAARLLGIGRNTITRKINAFGLDDIDASSHQTLKLQHGTQQTSDEPHSEESNGEIAKDRFSR